MLKNLFKEFILIFETLIRNLSGDFGRIIRRFYYSKRAARCGVNLMIDEGVIVQGIKNIRFGDNVWVDKNCILIAGKVDIADDSFIFKRQDLDVEEGVISIGSDSHIGIGSVIQGHSGVKIGDYFTCSAGVKIYSLSNDCHRSFYGCLGSDSRKYFIKSKIEIEDNVWLGLNSIVLGGVIGKDSFVAPNSLVMTSFKENSYISGNPAKKIKERFTNYGK